MAKDLSLYRDASDKVGDLLKDIEIGPDLTRHMSRQPGLFAYYAGIAEEAYHRAKRLKYEIHCMQEDLDYRIRKSERTKGTPEKGKGLTEGAIKARINRDPDLRALYEEYLEARKIAGILGTLTKAFDQRADMLRSIGAMMRMELDQGQINTLRAKASHVSKSLRKGARSEQQDDSDEDV